MRYFLYKDSEILGPMDPQEIESMPGLSGETLVCEEELFGHGGEWKALRDIRELAAVVPTAEPALVGEGEGEDGEPFPAAEFKDLSAAQDKLRQLNSQIQNLQIRIGEMDSQQGQWLRQLGQAPSASASPSDLTSAIEALQQRLAQLEQGQGPSHRPAPAPAPAPDRQLLAQVQAMQRRIAELEAKENELETLRARLAELESRQAPPPGLVPPPGTASPEQAWLFFHLQSLQDRLARMESPKAAGGAPSPAHVPPPAATEEEKRLASELRAMTERFEALEAHQREVLRLLSEKTVPVSQAQVAPEPMQEPAPVVRPLPEPIRLEPAPGEMTMAPLETKRPPTARPSPETEFQKRGVSFTPGSEETPTRPRIELNLPSPRTFPVVPRPELENPFWKADPPTTPRNEESVSAAPGPIPHGQAPQQPLAPAAAAPEPAPPPAPLPLPEPSHGDGTVQYAGMVPEPAPTVQSPPLTMTFSVSPLPQAPVSVDPAELERPATRPGLQPAPFGETAFAGVPTPVFAIPTAQPADFEPGAGMPAATPVVQDPSLRFVRPETPPSTRTRTEKRSFSPFILGGAAFVLLLAGVLHLFFRNPKDLSVMMTMEERKSAEAEAPRAARSAAPPAEAPKPAAPSRDLVPDPGEAAIALVKNYPLDGDRSSVGQWLQYSFMANPGDGSKEDWTAGAIDATTYMVQYQITPGAKAAVKERISYVFEADIARKTVMGRNPAARQLLAGVGPAAPTRSRRAPSAAPRVRPKAKPSAGKPAPKKKGKATQLPLPSDYDLLPPGGEPAKASNKGSL